MSSKSNGIFISDKTVRIEKHINPSEILMGIKLNYESHREFLWAIDVKKCINFSVDERNKVESDGKIHEVKELISDRDEEKKENVGKKVSSFDWK